MSSPDRNIAVMSEIEALNGLQVTTFLYHRDYNRTKPLRAMVWFGEATCLFIDEFFSDKLPLAESGNRDWSDKFQGAILTGSKEEDGRITFSFKGPNEESVVVSGSKHRVVHPSYVSHQRRPALSKAS